MERSFSEAVRQLPLGAGQCLNGEGVLVILKALLQSGVSYLGGYPGSLVAYLLDVMADANEPILKPLGIYFDSSESEAAAALRGAVCWKSTVGTNVASDALSHVASGGVVGGTLIIVGEDYGMGTSALAEAGFRPPEASGMPVIDSIRIRQAHIRGSVVCKDNTPPKISMLNRIHRPVYDITRIPLRPPRSSRRRGKVRRAGPGRQGPRARSRDKRPRARGGEPPRDYHPGRGLRHDAAGAGAARGRRPLRPEQRPHPQPERHLPDRT